MNAIDTFISENFFHEQKIIAALFSLFVLDCMQLAWITYCNAVNSQRYVSPIFVLGGASAIVMVGARTSLLAPALPLLLGKAIDVIAVIAFYAIFYLGGYRLSYRVSRLFRRS